MWLWHPCPVTSPARSRPLLRALLLLAGLLALSITVPAAASTRSCSRVLLLSAYPAEIRANLALLHQDKAQPQRIAGHAFYSGTLEGHRVVLALTGIGMNHARATTTTALARFSCLTAVAFSGTAGGKNAAGLGDVVVPDRWTANNGKSFQHVQARLLSQARAVVRRVSLETVSAVNVGPCSCDALGGLHAVPLPRTPHVIVGGAGTSYDLSAESACTPGGGALQGCDPCPPSTTPALPVPSGLSTQDYAQLLAPGVQPPMTRSTTASPYLLEDEETAAVMGVATAHHLPFLGFRGISDTDLPDMTWVAEYLVYQQLAADNAAAMARAWLSTQ
ncbi:MAG: hypothetical protein JWM40_3 [Frankiales bacterium]|nr:hypothetical protein [Frankiales bacterium]